MLSLLSILSSKWRSYTFFPPSSLREGGAVEESDGIWGVS